MIALIIFGSVLIFLLLALLLALFFLYRFTFYSPIKDQLDDFAQLDSPNFKPYKEIIIPLIKELKNKPYEDLYCQSFDKLKLHSRLFENKGSKKIAIMFHGYRGTAYRDFCGGAKEIMALGYTAVIVDQRAHGTSQGHSITFSVREVKDALSWFNYIKAKFGEDYEYIMIGISMGGATVLGVADKLPKNVKIIADCPYSTPKAILSETLKKLNLSVKFFYPIVNLSSIIYGHTNMNKMSAFDSIKNTNCKILIIHGDQDNVVPHYISQKLYEAYPEKIQYELFKGADHGASYLVDTERYRKVVRDFLQ